MKSQIDKIQILLESFEVLKEDWENNKFDILKIFDFIFKNSMPVAFEMWDFLLNRYWSISKPDSYLVSGILFCFNRSVIISSNNINEIIRVLIMLFYKKGNRDFSERFK